MKDMTSLPSISISRHWKMRTITSAVDDTAFDNSSSSESKHILVFRAQRALWPGRGQTVQLLSLPWVTRPSAGLSPGADTPVRAGGDLLLTILHLGAWGGAGHGVVYEED